MKRQIILLGVLAILSACNQQTIRKEGFGVHGIDVSHYQKHIDWKAVAAQEVRFAFVKASEGQSMQDSIFCKNWDDMRKAGILRGAYHFFRPGISAALQAQNFIATVDLQHGDLPPVLDVEVTDGYSSTEVTEGVKTWLAMVGDAWKIKPIVYTNQKFYNQHLAAYLQDYPIWVARYSDRRTPDLASGRSWDFWQYGNRGRLQGIAGDVDLNVFNGSFAELKDLTFSRPAPLLDRMPEPAPLPSAAPPKMADLGEPIAANP